MASQRWPAFLNAPSTDFSTARSRSASARTMPGCVSAQLEVHGLGAGAGGDAPADRGGAGEGDHRHVDVGREQVADVTAGAGDDVEHARRQPRLLEDASEQDER